MTKNIAIIGGGASALFLLKSFVDMQDSTYTLDIFDEGENFGMGMPYSLSWANSEHKVNFAFQEFPVPLEEPEEWLMRQSDSFLHHHDISRKEIGPLYIPSRIVTGLYFESQFYSLLDKARKIGLTVNIHTNCRIIDMRDVAKDNTVQVKLENGTWLNFTIVVIATGHTWPLVNERIIKGYYDSPFPLHKLNKTFNHSVGLMGSSLSAVDAIRTLSRNHGKFIKLENGNVEYVPKEGTENFKIVMHSRRGFLPSIRFYFEHPKLKQYLYISKEEIVSHIESNNGYLSLDFIFEKSYKDVIAESDPSLYEIIKNMRVEEFADFYYERIHRKSSFKHFQEELEIGKKSEENKIPIVWREAIDDMFYTLNFHAKSLSAEDTIRMRKYLMPLAYHDGAFLPFDSCEELIALHNAGKLKQIAVGYDSYIQTSPQECGATFHYKDSKGKLLKVRYDTFIECGGQRQLAFNAFPFKTLVNQRVVSQARVQFLSSEQVLKAKDNLPTGCFIDKIDNNYFLGLPGVAFNDDFQVIDTRGKVNPRIYIIANAFIKGMNPDFSGTPFCKDSAKMVMNSILQTS